MQHPEDDLYTAGTRLAAARQLHLPDVPVVLVKGLSEAQRRQLMLADNRIALNAGWDIEMLKLELHDLSSLGADLSVLDSILLMDPLEKPFSANC